MDIELIYGIRGGGTGRYRNSCLSKTKKVRLSHVHCTMHHVPDVNIFGDGCVCALEAAIVHDKITIVKILLDAGADVNCQCLFFGSPLVSATSRKNISMVQLLIDHGADLNMRDRYMKETALECALREGSPEIAYYLSLRTFTSYDVGDS